MADSLILNINISLHIICLPILEVMNFLENIERSQILLRTLILFKLVLVFCQSINRMWFHRVRMRKSY